MLCHLKGVKASSIVCLLQFMYILFEENVHVSDYCNIYLLTLRKLV